MQPLIDTPRLGKRHLREHSIHILLNKTHATHFFHLIRTTLNTPNVLISFTRPRGSLVNQMESISIWLGKIYILASWEKSHKKRLLQESVDTSDSQWLKLAPKAASNLNIRHLKSSVVQILWFKYVQTYIIFQPNCINRTLRRIKKTSIFQLANIWPSVSPTVFFWNKILAKNQQVRTEVLTPPSSKWMCFARHKHSARFAVEPLKTCSNHHPWTSDGGTRVFITEVILTLVSWLY